MQQLINNTNALSSKIKCLIENIPSLVIGIDGIKGAGKTYIANQLCLNINISYIGLDSYVSKNDKSSFRECFNYGKLERDINAILIRQKSIIVEGILLLEVLEKIRIKPSLLVYVEPGYTTADNIKEDFARIKNNSLEEIIEYYKHEKQSFGYLHNLNFTLDIEVADYHKKYNPVSKADFIVSLKN